MTQEKTCPVIPYARELAKIVRARATLDLNGDLGGDSLDHPILGDLAHSHVSQLLSSRANAIAQLIRFETAQSNLGACVQLALAFTTMPVSEIDYKVWKDHEGEKRKAMDRETTSEHLLMSAITHLAAQIDDPDLADILRIYGPPQYTEEITAATPAVMKLLEAAA